MYINEHGAQKHLIHIDYSELQLCMFISVINIMNSSEQQFVDLFIAQSFHKLFIQIQDALLTILMLCSFLCSIKLKLCLFLTFIALTMSQSKLLDILPRKRHRITDGPISNASFLNKLFIKIFFIYYVFALLFR